MDQRGRTSGSRRRLMKMRFPASVSRILERLRENGYEAWLVGGCVRDWIRGVLPADFDIATDASADTVRRLFSGHRVKLAGIAFPVCLVDHVEVATFRIGSDVEGIQGDLARRDLTVNSMAMDPESGRVLDPFGGKADAENGIIRFTGSAQDRINEDPCRMLRACRFAVLLGGELSDSARTAICRQANILSEVAPERLRLEVEKILSGPGPGRFIGLLAETNLLPHVFPSLAACEGVDGGPHHAETLLEHLMIAADVVSPKFSKLRLAALLHDTGKPAAREVKEGRVTFIGHERITGAAEADLDRLRFSIRDRQFVCGVIRTHMRTINAETSDRAVRRVLKALADAGVDWRDYVRMRIADRKANMKKPDRGVDEIRTMVRRIQAVLYPPASDARAALTLKDLAVNGEDVMAVLGLERGPEVGRILKRLLDAVIDDPRLNTREQLIKAMQGMADDGI